MRRRHCSPQPVLLLRQVLANYLLVRSLPYSTTTSTSNVNFVKNTSSMSQIERFSCESPSLSAPFTGMPSRLDSLVPASGAGKCPLVSIQSSSSAVKPAAARMRRHRLPMTTPKFPNPLLSPPYSNQSRPHRNQSLLDQANGAVMVGGNPPQQQPGNLKAIFVPTTT